MPAIEQRSSIRKILFQQPTRNRAAIGLQWSQMARQRERGHAACDQRGARSTSTRPAGLTQDQAAEISGIGVRTIGDIERGFGASASVLKQYAEKLDRNMDWHDLLREDVRVSLRACQRLDRTPSQFKGRSCPLAFRARNLLLTFQRLAWPRTDER